MAEDKIGLPAAVTAHLVAQRYRQQQVAVLGAEIENVIANGDAPEPDYASLSRIRARYAAVWQEVENLLERL